MPKFAANLSLSNMGVLVIFTGSITIHFLPAVVSYMYQNLFPDLVQCGSTEVEKIIFSNRLGENLDAKS